MFTLSQSHWHKKHHQITGGKKACCVLTPVPPLPSFRSQCSWDCPVCRQRSTSANWIRGSYIAEPPGTSFPTVLCSKITPNQQKYHLFFLNLVISFMLQLISMCLMCLCIYLWILGWLVSYFPVSGFLAAHSCVEVSQLNHS